MQDSAALSNRDYIERLASKAAKKALNMLPADSKVQDVCANIRARRAALTVLSDSTVPIKEAMEEAVTAAKKSYESGSPDTHRFYLT